VSETQDEVLEPALPEPPAPQLRMTPAILGSLCVELAKDIYPREELAARYGFASAAVMDQVLSTNAALQQRIKEAEIDYNASENLAAKVREHALIAFDETIPASTKMLRDPSTSPAARNDLLKILATVGGVHGTPAQLRAGEGGAGGSAGTAPFSVNIIFAGSGKVESFQLSERPTPAPVIEGDAT